MTTPGSYQCRGIGVGFNERGIRIVECVADGVTGNIEASIGIEPSKSSDRECRVFVVADQFFFVLHTALIVFNMVGWAWRRTRVLHLVTLGATAFSWFVLGAWYGWGYCLCTDAHFAIRRRMGLADPEHSYVQLLARHWFGLNLDLATANLIAGTVFVGIVIATGLAWTLDRRRARG